MRTTMRRVGPMVTAGVVASILVACGGVQTNPPTTTYVGASTGTIVQPSGLYDIDQDNDCAVATPPAPDPVARWNAMSPTDRRFPFTGFEIWRNTSTGCTSSRLDVYRAYATFNMASIANLRGLVTKAELIVGPRALPAAVGAHPQCVAFTGGAGALERFGPATEGNVPAFNPGGSVIVLPPPVPSGGSPVVTGQPFPVSTNVVFTVPTPWAVGTVAGATNPTTTTATGQGPAVFVVDVTGAVNAAINANVARMTYAVTSAFPGPLTAIATGGLDCRTPVDFRLAVTHY